MKKVIFIFLVALIPSFAFANVPITLNVETPSGTLYKDTLTVASCSVTDDIATTSVSAKCALEQAGLAPQWSNFGGDDWFLTAAGGATQDFENNLYWGWWSNLSYGQNALNKHELVPNESLLIALGVLPLRIDQPSTVVIGATTTVTVEEFGFDSNFNSIWSPSARTTVTVNGAVYETDEAGVFDIVATSTDPLALTATKSNFVSSTLVLTPTDAPAPPPAPAPVSTGGGSGDGGIVHQSLNVPAALAYLSSVQQDDGSFGSMLLSDWTALAFSAADPGSAKGKLRDYLLTATPSFGSTTDYERHALALLALGINPYSGTPVDVITPIVRSFDGAQIGDPSLDTDDIFALFPLLRAGYRASDDIIQKTAAFIVSRQDANGSWDGSTDVTAAAIQALSDAGALQGASDALIRAEAYLRAKQSADGGFGNSFTTSWVLQAIAVLHAQTSSFVSAGYTPHDYLAGLQQADGGLEPTSASLQTRVWATAYAVPAALGKTWSSLLVSFPRPETGSGIGTGNGVPTAAVLELSEDIIASTTPLLSLATSTLAQATSTVLADTSVLQPVESSITARAVVQPLPAKQEVRKAIETRVVTLDNILAASSRTAAVANAPGRTFFSRFWDSVVTFFSALL